MCAIYGNLFNYCNYSFVNSTTRKNTRRPIIWNNAFKKFKIFSTLYLAWTIYRKINVHLINIHKFKKFLGLVNIQSLGSYEIITLVTICMTLFIFKAFVHKFLCRTVQWHFSHIEAYPWRVQSEICCVVKETSKNITEQFIISKYLHG